MRLLAITQDANTSIYATDVDADTLSTLYLDADDIDALTNSVRAAGFTFERRDSWMKLDFDVRDAERKRGGRA